MNEEHEGIRYETLCIDAPRNVSGRFVVEQILNEYGAIGWKYCGSEYGYFILQRTILPD